MDYFYSLINKLQVESELSKPKNLSSGSNLIVIDIYKNSTILWHYGIRGNLCEPLQVVQPEEDLLNKLYMSEHSSISFLKEESFLAQ